MAELEGGETPNPALPGLRENMDEIMDGTSGEKCWNTNLFLFLYKAACVTTPAPWKCMSSEFVQLLNVRPVNKHKNVPKSYFFPLDIFTPPDVEINSVHVCTMFITDPY